MIQIKKLKNFETLATWAEFKVAINVAFART